VYIFNIQIFIGSGGCRDLIDKVIIQIFAAGKKKKKTKQYLLLALKFTLITRVLRFVEKSLKRKRSEAYWANQNKSTLAYGHQVWFRLRFGGSSLQP